ncbi:MAG: 2-C-methyl-D-erythritol 4-phosphate cytidylyltransferase [Chloroflexi bacterium]|nr:MAG: 2-C-methyl-D-erythritol 4-phosphate cytidylyltransferase [Chloroflexota bacterium]
MSGTDKTVAKLAGRPVLAHSLRAFAACDAIESIVLVAGPQNQRLLAQLAAQHGAGKVTAITPGGERRRDSVAAGLAGLSNVQIVVVHDTARPLVSDAMIRRGIELAIAHGAAIVAGPVTDTIKQVRANADTTSPETNDTALIERTIDRAALRAAQTPQTFRLNLLQRAHAATDADATDDAALVEALGEPVYCYDAGTPNPKITRPQDLPIVEALLRARPPAPVRS